MKPAYFEMHQPSTLVEALGLLEHLGGDAKVLAGGQSLVPVLNMRLARPGALIDLNRVAELSYIRTEADELRIGAMVRQRTAERSQTVQEYCPLLVQALRHIGHPQIRNRGTIGGSLSHADPSAELPAVMAALGATFVVASSRQERQISSREFFTGFMMTALEPDELLVEVRLPKSSPHAGCAFEEVARRSGDFAICGAAVQVVLDSQERVIDLRVGLTGVGPGPLVPDVADLTGQVLTESLIQEVGRRAVAVAEPEADLNGSVEYRLHLTDVCTRRALTEAAEQARRIGGGDQ